jgi:hypothetical protein
MQVERRADARQHEAVRDHHVATPGDRGGGQLESHLAVVPDPLLRGVEPRSRLLDVVLVRAAEASRRDLGLHPSTVRDDLRHPLLGLGLGGGAQAAVQLGAGLHELALLTSDVDPRVSDRAFSGVLLGREHVLVDGEPAGDRTDGAGVHLHDAVDVLEELAVVARHEGHATESVQRLGQVCTGATIEIVRRLVEQEHVRAAQEPSGQRQQHQLAAREARGVAVEPDPGEPEPVEPGARPLLDVPVVADGVEVAGVGAPSLDGSQGREGVGDVEHVRDAESAYRGHGVLRQQLDGAADRDDPLGGRQVAGEQPEQGRLAASVRADEAVDAGSEVEVDVGEHGGAVGPGVGEVVQGQGRGHGASGEIAGGRGCVSRAGARRQEVTTEGPRRDRVLP